MRCRENALDQLSAAGIRRSLRPPARPRADASPASPSAIDTSRIMRAEHQPVRRLVLVGILRPGQPAAADQSEIDADRVRPVECDRWFPAAPCAIKRVCERDHAGIESCGARAAAARPAPAPPRIRRGRTARQRQGCRRLPRAALALRMREGVADLAQGHEPERRRQVDGRPRSGSLSGFASPQTLCTGALDFDWYNYSLAPVASANMRCCSSNGGPETG